MGGVLEIELNKVAMYSLGAFSFFFFGCGDTSIFVCE
jgi:hypothetical protein